MFLKQIKIANIRGIRDLKLPFTDPAGEIRKWTLILGENGTGKSTLLRAIALVLAGRDALPELVDEPDSWVRAGCKSGRIGATLVTKTGDERGIELRIRRGAGHGELIDENRESLEELDRALRHSARNYLVVGYGVSRRLAEERFAFSKAEVFRQPRAQSLASLFVSDASLVPFETWAMDLDYRHKGGIALVRSAFRAFLPDVEFAKIDRDNRQLLFKTPDGTVPLRYLSDGYQNVIAWCGDLLHRITTIFEDYKQPLHARGLLMIDEIDLHLHPVWQRELINFLSERLPNFQILATTHSPFTAQQAGEGVLFGLRRTSRGPHLEPFAGEPRKLLLHQLLMTPVFGSLTMNSREVEQQREEYRRLDAKQEKTAGDQERLEELRELLADHPDWSMSPPVRREISEMLKKIRES
ncbi:MAG: AAA family ATPase [bacterium]|nr:AAA family ATPase [bacterium]